MNNNKKQRIYINFFNPAKQHIYLCKQCRTRCDDSIGAVSFSSRLFATTFGLFLPDNSTSSNGYVKTILIKESTSETQGCKG